MFRPSMRACADACAWFCSWLKRGREGNRVVPSRQASKSRPSILQRGGGLTLTRGETTETAHMIATSATNDDADKAGCDAYTGVECVRSCERIAL
jgi:hypothetical protein